MLKYIGPGPTLKMKISDQGQHKFLTLHSVPVFLEQTLIIVDCQNFVFSILSYKSTTERNVDVLILNLIELYFLRSYFLSSGFCFLLPSFTSYYNLLHPELQKLRCRTFICRSTGLAIKCSHTFYCLNISDKSPHCMVLVPTAWFSLPTLVQTASYFESIEEITQSFKAVYTIDMISRLGKLQTTRNLVWSKFHPIRYSDIKDESIDILLYRWLNP